jgi:hypothetical protein
MNRGLENGFILGNSKGMLSGLGSGLQSGNVMTNRLNMLNPAAITDPKTKPVFYVNADNVALTSGAISIVYNLVDALPGDLLPKVENIFTQAAGTTYRPPLVVGGLNGKNYMNFADTGNRYLESAPAALYAQTAPQTSGIGFTYIFIIKRLPGATRSILDGRDSTTLATTNDILIEVNAEGRITFDYKGGNSGSVTSLTGTAGVNLLNNWSILTIKTQLRNDGGYIPSDSDNYGTIAKRYAMPCGAKIGNPGVIDIFVNGVEQQKTITTNTYTNADYYNDGTFRMLDRDIFIGNKGNVFGTSGTHIGAFLMIPTYITKGLQQRLENYFRWYYSLPF